MNLTKDQEKEIIRLYVEEKRGQTYCSKRVLKVNKPNIIKKVLKKHGIKVRNYYEAKALN